MVVSGGIFDRNFICFGVVVVLLLLISNNR